jgi:HD-GYP domain-containing protein (c-di-GMP phosphodiesterase class II)
MSKYLPVRVSTFRGDKRIPFNTYVHVGGKYILFCREGDSFEDARLERLKSKKLQKMYVPVEHFEAYKAYTHENIERAYDDTKKAPAEIRSQIIHGAVQATAEDLMEDPLSQEFYGVALEAAKRFSKFLFSEPEALKAMLDIKNLDFSVAHHGVNVAALALVIAEDLKLTETNPMQIDFLVLGCMIHDIENNYHNIDLTVDPKKLGKTEKQIHARHPIDGYTRIRKVHFYDPTVLDIVMKHDEKIDGSGPLHLLQDDIPPLVQVAATANMFDRLLTYDGLAPKEALKKLLIDEMGSLSLESMRALQNGLKKRALI